MATNNSDTRPLWQWSAVDLAQAIKSGQLSSSEVTNAVLDRIADKNPGINAIVDDLSDEARETAAKLDSTLKVTGPVGPLHGVPVTIKVNIDVKGHANTNGIDHYKDNIAPDDAPLVASLRRAGAVIVGITNTPEFSFRATTDNRVHGRTINPWDEKRSPGGSSGGASAAIAAGFGPLAHGNDIGGSLRFPSFCCGAVTVKPGQGRIPSFNPSAAVERSVVAQLASTQGMIAREVKDVRLAMSVITKPDPRDPWHVPQPFPGPKPEGQIKVAVTTKSNGYDIHPSIVAAVERAAGILADAGYWVEEVDPPFFEEAAKDALPTIFGDAKVFMNEDVEQYGSDTIKQIFADYYKVYQVYGPDDILRSMARRTGYLRAWNKFLSEHHLILSPFLMRPTYDWDEDARGEAAVKDIMDSAAYSWTLNYLGLPAAIAPAGFVDNLPISVQIIGGKNQEGLCLDAAEVIEKAEGIQIHELWRRNGERD